MAAALRAAAAIAEPPVAALPRHTLGRTRACQKALRDPHVRGILAGTLLAASGAAEYFPAEQPESHASLPWCCYPCSLPQDVNDLALLCFGVS